MNVIVVLQTSNATYRNSLKAHVIHSSRFVQQVLDHLRVWNTSQDMYNFVNNGLPTPTKKQKRKS